MARSNPNFEKRLREQKKRAKREEKARRKAERDAAKKLVTTNDVNPGEPAHETDEPPQGQGESPPGADDPAGGSEGSAERPDRLPPPAPEQGSA